VRDSPRWLRWLAAAGIAWALVGLGISLASDRSARNLTLVISIASSGAYTVLLYLSRRAWLPRLARRPVAGATAIGIFNAALVEALFLAVQTALGATGVAAHPNLLMDWLITMPWYAGMVWIFVRVQRRERYSAAAVLLWGAAYEAGADGLVGGLVGPAVFGGAPAPLQHLVFLAGLAFWQFIPVYSSLVLAPALVLDAAARRRVEPAVSRAALFAPGLKPFGWLAIYTVYLLVVYFVIGLFRLRNTS
jgi:hypothetical protein